MKSASLRKYNPHLESVLGPLSVEDDSKIRTIFASVDFVLLEIARHFNHDRADMGRPGLELNWMESGQIAISSGVAGCVNQKCVEFIIELRPSWFYGERSSELTWEIEISIHADCQHASAHGGMDNVYENSNRAVTAVEAAEAVLTAAYELKRLVTSFALEHWLRLASDADG